MGRSRGMAGQRSAGISTAGWLSGIVMLVLIVLLASPAVSQTQARSDIPWRDDLRYSRTSVDDDIRSVLRSILRTAGISAIFRPGVQAEVSLRFDDVLPRHAFEQLLIEQGLGYEYNAQTRTVTIFMDSAEADQVVRREFVTLTHARFDAIRSMLTRFGIATEGVAHDPATNTLLIQGRTEYLTEVTDLIARVEESERTRQELELEQVALDRKRRRAELEQSMYQQMLEADVKVIPLRFASVGQTTRRFHGTTVTVPGIEQTLTAMLGQLSIDSNVARRGDAADGEETEDQFFRRLQQIARPVVSVDQRTNSVIVRGTDNGIIAVEKVVLQLDQPLRMVEIEVIIATAEVGVAEELGVALRGSVSAEAGANRSGAFDSGSSGTQVGNGNGTLFDSDGLNALSLLPVVAAPNATLASFVIGSAGNILQAQLNLLEEENKAQVLSAPRLVTLDNVTARITRAQDLFVQVDTGGDNGQSLAEIQTGLTLEITPSIVPSTVESDDSLVRLSINAVNSAPGAGVFGQIDVRSQEVQTEVLVPNGATYVIGGLFDDDRREQKSGVPGLKDMPLLGWMFGNESSTNNLSETIFFITPKVVHEGAPFAQDIAQRSGTTAYVSKQRGRLSSAADALMGGKGRAFPNVMRSLEEDE